MTSYEITYSRYCEGCSSDGSLVLTPLPQWLLDNFVTRDQLNRLLKRRSVVAKKFKGRIYVAWHPAYNPDLDDRCF